ncbi:hypothetical protein TGAM01_v206754 [Trichoderma gamsii]|uniref:Uncharacterized protein n=1 Tax=Trichoderma gamsii TaxID=398673 RepID=A0A2P4ZJH6_9HYPO|nr:hypothetical protein TGAM01_v206754 [Trichoderma gamsii]PON24422.1 hypothetical protein TGAM01_v206754 [Trichoderma gamsii]
MKPNWYLDKDHIIERYASAAKRRRGGNRGEIMKWKSQLEKSPSLSRRYASLKTLK